LRRGGEEVEGARERARLGNGGREKKKGVENNGASD